MATKAHAETARRVGRPSPVGDELERLKALDDTALTEALLENGYIPKDGENLVIPGDLHDKRYYRMVIRTDKAGRMAFTTIKKPDDPAYFEMSNPCFVTEDELWSSIRRHLKDAQKV